jgi:hypothetical protein
MFRKTLKLSRCKHSIKRCWAISHIIARTKSNVSDTCPLSLSLSLSLSLYPSAGKTQRTYFYIKWVWFFRAFRGWKAAIVTSVTVFAVKLELMQKQTLSKEQGYHDYRVFPCEIHTEAEERVEHRTRNKTQQNQKVAVSYMKTSFLF